MVGQTTAAARRTHADGEPNAANAPSSLIIEQSGLCGFGDAKAAVVQTLIDNGHGRIGYRRAALVNGSIRTLINLNREQRQSGTGILNEAALPSVPDKQAERKRRLAEEAQRLRAILEEIEVQLRG